MCIDFFKQKTEYEWRMSDWSSDVCSSDLEKALGELAVKGRDGKISLDEMTGGTFSITNGGVFGSMMSTPILNMPQAAILGLHKIKERPVAVKIGRASCRERVCQYVSISLVAVSFKKSTIVEDVRNE